MVNHFNGYDYPDSCKCGFVWPDIINLKEKVEDRIAYHINAVTE